MQASFFWHDYETFGSDPRRDRPAQFAGIRTDENLEPIAEPVVWYCRPTDDLLPHPEACRITGITPQLARRKGLPEQEFAGRIHAEFSVAGTCGIGFNNFRFDDEVGRHLFFRNYLDPYSREYANGNSRLDLIDILRLAAATRPTGIEWPRREDGSPSFRLEDLAAANGLDTSRAHDALADVEATLEMARKLRTAQPRLWDWCLGLRDRWQVERLLSAGKPLLHASSRYPAKRFCTAPVGVVGSHPRFRGQWVVWDLEVDPAPFMELDPDLLPDLLFTPAEDLPEDLERLPVKLVRANRAPMLAPLGVAGGDEARVRVDSAAVERNHRQLQASPEFRERLQALFQPETRGEAEDPELGLYDGFIPDADRKRMALVRGLSGEELARSPIHFDDHRLAGLLLRYRARNWPETLDESERRSWDEYRRARLVDDDELAGIRIPDYLELLDAMERSGDGPVDILRDLRAWLEELDPEGTLRS